jgi:dTDP-4-dehydrorhamnose 3,5-epimerase
MRIESTSLPGVFLIRLSPKIDERGYFARAYDKTFFQTHGLVTDWVQENESLSVAPFTIRGLHFQRGASAETKMVRVTAGALLDVVVDLRHDSPTFGRHVAVKLAEDDQTLLYIPKGFAHGFCSLMPDTVIRYKVDHPYDPANEGGLLWNDKQLGIQWPVTSAVVISSKDETWPGLEDLLASPGNLPAS